MREPKVVYKKLNQLEVAKQLNQARIDLPVAESFLKLLSTVPVKFTQEEINWLNERWPVTPAQIQDGSYIQIWKDMVNKQVIYIKQYVSQTEQWMKDRLDKPYRCALPKKKQRELGMLPPV
jgi:hypothetical protein